ncbi:cadmium resistance transporter [Nonomuraea sp. NPDC050383]|uniref:cadmium resistance transporter n=1 Tax=Nonomuraea sp. NPDC050383 TaxID=3364362 RepID=UPI0037880B6A
MEGIAGTVVTAAGMFAGTNVDDLIVLTVLFLSSRAGGVPRPWQIWAGQYTGIATLVALSVIAALGLTIIPDAWVGLLGLLPFALGVRGLAAALRSRKHPDDGDGAPSAAGVPAVASGVLPVAGVTIANGADNLSVYTPVFRTIGPVASLVTIAVFAAGVALWCLAGSWLGSHRQVIGVVERYGHWIVPVVFMAVGALIVLGSGVLTRLPPFA